MRFFWGFLGAVFIFIIIIIAFGIYSIKGGALAKPSRFQDAIINRAKNWFIPEARQVPAPPERNEQAILEGGEHFNHHCAVCHDLDGDADSLFAESFHPRVADLAAGRVQNYTDAQLKWIIDFGIRYTAMPGWAKLVNDSDQWNIVYYMRILDDPEQMEKYRGMLRERGKWKIEVPVAGHGNDDGHEH